MPSKQHEARAEHWQHAGNFHVWQELTRKEFFFFGWCISSRSPTVRGVYLSAGGFSTSRQCVFHASPLLSSSHSRPIIILFPATRYFMEYSQRVIQGVEGHINRKNYYFFFSHPTEASPYHGNIWKGEPAPKDYFFFHSLLSSLPLARGQHLFPVYGVQTRTEPFVIQWGMGVSGQGRVGSGQENDPSMNSACSIWMNRHGHCMGVNPFSWIQFPSLQSLYEAWVTLSRRTWCPEFTSSSL